MRAERGERTKKRQTRIHAQPLRYMVAPCLNVRCERVTVVVGEVKVFEDVVEANG